MTVETMTRILSLKLGADPHGKIVVEELRRLIPNLWIAGVEEHLNTPDSVFDEIVTSHYDAFLGRYEKVHLPSIPVTPELHQLIHPFEGQGLNMLERVRFHASENYPGQLHGVPKFHDSYESREDLFMRHCRFWNYILDSYQIQAVVSQNFGHQGFDFVALQLAKAKGIPTLIFTETGQFPTVQFVQEDVRGLGNLTLGAELKRRTHKELERESDDFIRAAFLKIARSPDQAGVRKVDEFKTSLAVSWLVDSDVHTTTITIGLLLRLATRKFARFIRSPIQGSRAIFRTRRRVFETKQSMKEERRLARFLVPDAPYIYFPLHFQPEASTASKGRHFYRLREAVAFLASSLPPGWTLVVKEHPHQWRRFLPRPAGFFEQLVAVPQVQLLHHSIDNNSIVQGARAVACVSHSSITSFAFVNNIPVISLGDSHLRSAPGYFCIENSTHLKQVVKSIADGSIKKVDSDLETFISQLEKSTFEGVLGHPVTNADDVEIARVLQVTKNNIPRIVKEWLILRGILVPTQEVAADIQ